MYGHAIMENGQLYIDAEFAEKSIQIELPADDNIVKLLSIAVKPLSLLPFPMEYFEQLVMSENTNIEIDSKLD